MNRSARPLVAIGGRPQTSLSVQPGAAPSTPMMRMSRFSRVSISASNWSSSPASADRSTITGRPAKKVGERAIWAANASSHSSTGDSGIRTKATKERPFIRREGLAVVDTGRGNSIADGRR